MNLNQSEFKIVPHMCNSINKLDTINKTSGDNMLTIFKFAAFNF